jgi:hypothetical protein
MDITVINIIKDTWKSQFFGPFMDSTVSKTLIDITVTTNTKDITVNKAVMK